MMLPHSGGRKNGCKELGFHNDGDKTRVNIKYRSESVIDLILSLAGISNSNVLRDSKAGSDHYPKLIQFGLDIAKYDNEGEERLIF